MSVIISHRHTLAGMSASLFDDKRLLIRCPCGAEAQYDRQWGCVVYGTSGHWSQAEAQAQREIDEGRVPHA